MKIPRILLVAAALLFLLNGAPGFARGMSPAQHRAMFERARQVKSQKNRFIIKALNAYGISFRLNEDRDVTMIELGERWWRVHAVEVVPNIMEEQGLTMVTGHTIYFSTDSGWVSIHMTGTSW